MISIRTHIPEMLAHFCHLIFQLWVVWCELRKKRKLRNCWHGMKLGWPSYLFGKPTIKAQVCNNLWLQTKITKQCYQKNPFFFMSQKKISEYRIAHYIWQNFFGMIWYDGDMIRIFETRKLGLLLKNHHIQF